MCIIFSMHYLKFFQVFSSEGAHICLSRNPQVCLHSSCIHWPFPHAGVPRALPGSRPPPLPPGRRPSFHCPPLSVHPHPSQVPPGAQRGRVMNLASFLPVASVPTGWWLRSSSACSGPCLPLWLHVLLSS